MKYEEQVVLSFYGTEFVVPKKAGMAVFELLTGENIYVRSTRWEKVDGSSSSKDVPYIRVVEPAAAPVLKAIGPVDFHIGLENQRMRDEREAKESNSA